MTSTLRAARAATLAAGAVLAAAAIASPAAVQGVLDRGRFVVFQGDVPIGTERFEYLDSGDSISVSSTVFRRVSTPDGPKPYTKKMVLVASRFDFGLMRYLSNEEFDGHIKVAGVLPGDTSMTVYREVDGRGTADRYVQPPGRLFVVDQGMFTLFDVLCRNVSSYPFHQRPVQLVALTESGAATPQATIERGGLDTVSWGGKRTITRVYTLRDSSGLFHVWADRDGRMLRLVHDASGLTVERDASIAEPAPAAKRPPRR